MAKMRVILRPISGVNLPRGAKVDVSGWKNARQLEEMRYLGRIVLEDEE